MERIGKYFEGVAWKYLSAVDAEADRSNQHELGGLPRAGFKEHLGDPGNEVLKFPAKFIRLADNESESLSVLGQVSWYDSRRHDPTRSAELRLYYDGNPVTETIREGMFLLIAKTRQGEILLIFTDPESSAERQIRWLFALEGAGERLTSTKLEGLPERPSWAASWILAEIGVETTLPDEVWLGRLLKTFGERFPTTKEFSAFARKAAGDIDPVGSPDDSLVVLVDTEERLFRLLERHLVADRIRDGFDDVDFFISYSLSIQNRRKSRVGHALENHLEFIFQTNDILYSRGSVTENRSKPDFLFPGATTYHDSDFPEAGLTMLGAKSTCKDRWRQVLSEARRISDKHLATLEPSISIYQLEEMSAKKLQLVIPRPIHETYSEIERGRLWALEDFLAHVRECQQKYSA